MRSKIGTKSRLAAHLAALALFVVIVAAAAPLDARQPVQSPSPRPVIPDAAASAPVPVAAAAAAVNPAPVASGALESIAPLPATPSDPTATVDRDATPVTATQVEPDALRPPGAGDAPVRPARQAPGIAASGDAPAETLEKVATLEPVTEPLRPSTDTTRGSDFDATPSEPASGVIDPVPDVAASTADSSGVTEAAAPQPDESGSMVVAQPEPGAPSPDLAPLSNANLEVLGDNVYWLSPRHDLEKELAAVDRLGSVILLAPLPGHRVHGLEYVKTEVIPADIDDLGREAADRFLHLAADKPGNVIVAVQPGARGAAFFKGAYFLAFRNMPMDDVIAEIAPELDEAGEARDEIIHRLMRLKD